MTEDGRTYVSNPIYPTIPYHEEDIYIIAAVGDRYDLLAKRFYDNGSYWWVIASANTSKRDSLTVEPGIQLRIPHELEKALQQFEEVNRKR